VPPAPAPAVPAEGAEVLPPVFAPVGSMDPLQGETAHEPGAGESFEAFEHATTDSKQMVL
jgi:hypothetical protein